MKIIKVTPDRVTKHLLKEPLEFYLTVEGDFEKAEVWSEIPCESHPLKGGYAIPLKEKESKENNIKIMGVAIKPTKCGFYQFSIRVKKDNRWHWVTEEGTTTNPEKRKKTEVHIEPSWSKVIIYNSFVRQFGAKDKDNDGIIRPGEGGTFNDLIKRMEYFKKLGIGAIYLNPIQITGELFKYEPEGREYYKNNLTNNLPVHMHPGSIYAIKEYKSIDPELGLNEENKETDQYIEFRRFCHECHKNDIRVILDVVFDHTARDSFIQRLHPEWFLYKKNPRNLNEEFITPDHEEAEKYWGNPENIVSPYDHGIFWGDCALLNWNEHYWRKQWAPESPKPPKNPAIKDMREYFKSVLKYWIKNYGVDGFRLDVSYAIPPEFWKEAIAESREYAEKTILENNDIKPLSPDILFIGETYNDRIAELQESGITMVNGDYAWKIYNVETLKGYLDYIYNISGYWFPENTQWLLFPECHDGPRLPKKFKELIRTENADAALNKSRWALTATLPGTPMLHNGYEVLEKQNVSIQTYTAINWNNPRNIIEYIAKINKIRNEHEALNKGSYEFINTEQGVTPSAQLYAFMRECQNEKIIVIVNMDINNPANGVQISLPERIKEEYKLTDLITGEEYERKGRNLTIILGPGESHIFLLED